MRADDSRYLCGAVLLAGLIGVSCGEISPGDATAPTSTAAVTLAAEPAKVMPEFFPSFDASCSRRSFRTRFVAIVGSMGSAAVQTLGVSFTDRFGVFATPAVVPASDVFTGLMMTAPPIRLATSSAIPFAVTLPNNALSTPAGTSQRVPLTLEFGCHVDPHGTIIVVAGTRDDRGRWRDHRLAISVGE
jgi:hypothetical protein